MFEPFDQPLASGFGDSAGFMDRMGSEQNSAFDSFYKFLDNSERLLTMMRYLQPRELERRGLDKFDPWTGTYGVANESLEPTPSGGCSLTSRFSRFKNLPELKALWQNLADIRVARESPRYSGRVPTWWTRRASYRTASTSWLPCIPWTAVAWLLMRPQGGHTSQSSNHGQTLQPRPPMRRTALL